MKLSNDEIDALLHKPAPEFKPIDRTVTGVINHFASVVFNCTYEVDGIRCKARTNYLFMGQPACLRHCQDRLADHSAARGGSSTA